MSIDNEEECERSVIGAEASQDSSSWNRRFNNEMNNEYIRKSRCVLNMTVPNTKHDHDNHDKAVRKVTSKDIRSAVYIRRA